MLVFYAVTKIDLTASCILSLLSLNSYTRIAGADAKQAKELHTQFTSRLLSSQITSPEMDDRIARMEDFLKYAEMSITPCGKRYFV